MSKKRMLSAVLSALLIFAAGCRRVEPKTYNSNKPNVSAWVVDWDLKRGLEEAAGISGLLGSVDIFAAYFNQDGKAFLPENLKKLIKEPKADLQKRGLNNAYLTVVNDIFYDDGRNIQKDSKLIADIMLNEQKRKEHLKDLVDLVVSGPFKGLTLDYEKVPDEAFDEYALFIEELGSKLKGKGKGLRIVLEPRSPIEAVKLPREYEYTMMAYNLHDTRTAPGPKADKQLINKLSDKMIRNFSNIRMAFSLGGFDWPETGNANAVTQQEAEELLLKSGAEKKRYSDSGAVYFDYVDKDGIKHTVCYADEETVLFWTKTAQQKGINRFAFWRLGGNSPDTLEKVKDYLSTEALLDNISDNRDDEKSDVMSGAVTARKILSLTFNGLPDEKKTGKILDALDALNIKATFFISGIKAAEEEEAVRMIVSRGHEIGNSTLSGADLTKENYTEKVKQISKSHDVITKFAGIEPKYLRPGYGAVDDEVLLAAKSCGYDNIITYSVNPQDWDNKTPEEVAKIVGDKKKKGAVIMLSADKNPRVDEVIPLIYKSLKAKGYELVPLKELVEINKQRKENEYKPAEALVKVDPEFKNTKYRIIEEGPAANEDRVSLTFDDWGSDDNLDELLDILDKYNVKATFFLRAKGVENNPSLALAISERGHEIANHTYSHVDLDKLTPLEIQEDLVKAHEVIAKAINKEPSRYMRPPRGIVDPKVAEAVAACGYSDIIMYSVTALDWKEDVTAEQITDSMVNKSFDGAILLLHVLDNINTTKALPSIIEGLRAKGYKLVTVGEMLNNK